MLCAATLVAAASLVAPIGVDALGQDTDTPPAPDWIPDSDCTGNLTSPNGYIHTPNFPGAFRVPIKCRWVIDASAHSHPLIIVYFTQIYVLTGLTMYGYGDYGSRRFAEKKVHAVSESNVVNTQWASFEGPYLVVHFSMDRLEGNHLRVLNPLDNVFGFNFTYEVKDRMKDKSTRPSCSPLQCSFLGNCYVSQDYQNFSCACLPGYSGLDCVEGPLCRKDPDMCKNGGTCSYAGTEFVVCNCSNNYSGTFCEIPPLPDELRECDASGGQTCNCSHGPLVQEGRSRYIVEVRIANISAGPLAELPEDERFQHINRTFGRMMTEYLAGSNITLVTDLQVLNITPAGDVRFHVVCGKQDASAVQSALNKLMDKCPGCLGNINLVGTHFSFAQEPMLLLKKLEINVPHGMVRSGEDFILSCVAQGSSSMKFTWYKDDVPINASLSTARKMWTQVLPRDGRDQWTALLGAERVLIEDAGRFTCRVEDWGAEQCRFIDLQVLSPPKLSIRPIVHTLVKGANVTTRCFYPPLLTWDHDHPPGITWTRNGDLVALTPDKEVYEDLLYPRGSILRLYNVQNSASYDCAAHNEAGSSRVHCRVDVIDEGDISACPQDGGWAATPAGRQAFVECYDSNESGSLATRHCTQSGDGAVWELPDYSQCMHDHVVAIKDQFVRLTLGYASTTALDTLTALRRWLVYRGAAKLREREGEPILKLALEIARYEDKVHGSNAVLSLREQLFRVIDLLLQNGHAVRADGAIREVQEMFRDQALLWAWALASSTLPATAVSSSALSSGPPSSTSSLSTSHETVLDQVAVHVVGVADQKVLVNDIAVPASKWDDSKTRVRLYLSNTRSQRPVVAAVVAFRALHKLLPERSIAELQDGSELQYEVASSLVSVAIGSESGKIVKVPPSKGDFAADVTLQVTVPEPLEGEATVSYSWPRWNMMCAVTDIASGLTSPGPLPWNTSACETLSLSDSLTGFSQWQAWDPQDLEPGNFLVRCNCSSPGTIAVLLASNTSELGLPHLLEAPGLLVTGLLLCALQTAITVLLLLPHWISRPTCLPFLKLQSSALSTLSSSLLLYGLLNIPAETRRPEDADGAFMALVHCFILGGISAHLGKLLLLYTELVGVQPLPYFRPSLMIVVTGTPLVPIASGLLAVRSIRHTTKVARAGWAPWGTTQCAVLVATTALVVLFYVAILIAVCHHLRNIKAKDNQQLLQRRRFGLIRRSAIILCSQLAFLIAFVVYISIPGVTSSYFAAASCTILGSATLLSYVVWTESRDQVCWPRGSTNCTSNCGTDVAAASQPLTSCCLRDVICRLLGMLPCWESVFARPSPYHLVPARPAGPEPETPAAAAPAASCPRSQGSRQSRPSLPIESLCPFLVFTKQDAETESDAAALSTGTDLAETVNAKCSGTRNGGSEVLRDSDSLTSWVHQSRRGSRNESNGGSAALSLGSKEVRMAVKSTDPNSEDSEPSLTFPDCNKYLMMSPLCRSAAAESMQLAPVPCYIRMDPSERTILTCLADVEPRRAVEKTDILSNDGGLVDEENVLERISNDLDYLLSDKKAPKEGNS